MSVDFQCLKNWLIANKLTLNMIKTEFMLVGSRQRIATMTVNMHAFINGISLSRVNYSKRLGVEIDEFYPHCKCVKESVVWLKYHEKDQTSRSNI